MFKKLVLFFLCMLLLTGCGKPIIKKSPEVIIRENMINRSLLFIGDTSRIHDKLSAAKHGENLTVAYLGGSITNGFGIDEEKNYAKLSFNAIKEFVGKKANLAYLNLGINGADSILGNTIAESEMLSKNADIIFIEYATDDKPEQIYRENYESLIRTCLNNKNKPAVILIIACNDKGVSRQDFITQLGKYYNLPVIAVANAVEPEISASRMKPEEYFADEINPTESGHKLMSDFILNYIKKAYKTKQKNHYEVPSKMYPKSVFENVKFISAKAINSDNDGSYTRKSSNNKIFSDLAEYMTKAGNLPFEFTLKANNIYIITPTYSEETCFAEVFVNDEEKPTIINLKSDNKYNSPKAFLIYSSEKLMPVKIKIKIPDNEDNNVGFAELEKSAETAENIVKNDDTSASESNFPAEEKVITISKKEKMGNNTVPFSFYGIAYNKNNTEENNRGK